MCSFLHIFLGFTVLFTFIKDYAAQNYCTPEGAERKGQSETQLVFTQARLDFAQQTCFEEDQTYSKCTSQQRRHFHCENRQSNESGRRRPKQYLFPLAVCLWENQQEICDPMCGMLGIMEKWDQAPHSTQVSRGPKLGHIRLARVGELGREFELGIQPLIKSVIRQIPSRWRWSSSAESAEAYPERKERQRERKERYEAWDATEPRRSSRTGVTISTRRQFCTLDTDGCFPIHACNSSTLKPICFSDASKYYQRETRDGRVFTQSIPRSGQNARGHKAVHRKNRTGDRKNGDQELAPGHEVFGQSEKNI